LSKHRNQYRYTRRRRFWAVVFYSLLAAPLLFGDAGIQFRAINPNNSSFFSCSDQQIPVTQSNVLQCTTKLTFNYGAANPSLLLGGINALSLDNGTNGDFFAGTGSTAIGGSGANTGNTAVGYQAGQSLSAASQQNAFFGGRAGNGVTGGTQNTYVGQDAGRLGNNETDSTFLGYATGNNNTGSNNTYLGANITNNQTAANATIVGQGITGNCSNCTLLGSNPVGISTTSPAGLFWVGAGTNPTFQVKTSSVGINVSPVATAFFQASAPIGRTDESLAIAGPVTLTDGISLNAVDNPAAVNKGFEIRGSTVEFTGTNAVMFAGPSAPPNSQALCTLAGQLGHCTSIVGAGGGCTCVAP